MTAQALQEISGITLDDGIAVFRIQLASSLQAAIESVRDAIAEAHAQHHWKLMVVIGAPSGIDAPSVAMRAGMVRQWAEASRGVVAVAMVCAPRYIDPQSFGVIMAANFGMVSNVLVDEAAAREWLQQQR